MHIYKRNPYIKIFRNSYNTLTRFRLELKTATKFTIKHMQQQQQRQHSYFK